MKRGRKPQANGRRPVKWIPASAGAELQRLQFRLLTVQDVCRIYQIGRSTLYNYRNTRKLPRPDISFPGLVRWKFSTLKKFIS